MALGRAGEAEGKLGGCLHWLREEWEAVGGEEKARTSAGKAPGSREGGAWRAFGIWRGVCVCFKWEQACLDINDSSQEGGVQRGAIPP